MSVLLLVAVGGAVGAVGRHLIDSALTAATPGDYPWGVLAANVIGSFVIGLVAPRATPEVAALVVTGFCGALTTYSTVAAGVWGLLRQGRVGRGVVVLTVTVLGALAAVTAGITCASALARV